MGGPIVRTGTTPEFWKNWDRVFGDKSKSASTKKTAGSAKKAAGKSAKKKAASKKAKAKKK